MSDGGSRIRRQPSGLILRIRQITGGQLEHQLDPQYTFAQVVASIDAALDEDRPLKLSLGEPGHEFVLNPDATLAIALVEP